MQIHVHSSLQFRLRQRKVDYLICVSEQNRPPATRFILAFQLDPPAILFQFGAAEKEILVFPPGRVGRKCSPGQWQFHFLPVGVIFIRRYKFFY